MSAETENIIITFHYSVAPLLILHPRSFSLSFTLPFNIFRSSQSRSAISLCIRLQCRPIKSDEIIFFLFSRPIKASSSESIAAAKNRENVKVLHAISPEGLKLRGCSQDLSSPLLLAVYREIYEPFSVRYNKPICSRERVTICINLFAGRIFLSFSLSRVSPSRLRFFGFAISKVCDSPLNFSGST